MNIKTPCTGTHLLTTTGFSPQLPLGCFLTVPTLPHGVRTLGMIKNTLLLRCSGDTWITATGLVESSDSHANLTFDVCKIVFWRYPLPLYIHRAALPLHYIADQWAVPVNIDLPHQEHAVFTRRIQTHHPRRRQACRELHCGVRLYHVMVLDSGLPLCVSGKCTLNKIPYHDWTL